MTIQPRKLSNRICIAAVALVAAAVMNAQTTSGTIVGTVTDSSGGVVSGASITITNEGTGAVRRFDTGADGYYAATLLPGGIYSVEVVKAGFKKAKVSGVMLEVNQAARTDIILD